MQKLTIGIVLPQEPGYSETFFHSKIKGLVEHGHKVILFVNKNNHTFEKCEVAEAPAVHSKNPLLQLYYFIKVFGRLLFTAFDSVKNFIKLEKQDGASTRDIIEKIYINAHILSHRLDWLHFGFSTMAVKRENVAKAVGAKMAISFRGYDISIFPKKNMGCYDKLWKKVDQVHSISEDLYKQALVLGLSKDIPMHKITPAINLNQFYTGRMFTCFNKPVKLLTVGRLKWVKGLDYALLALSLLSQRGVDFVYNIVGAGEDLERLTFAANQLGIQDNVNFLGKKSPDEVKAYMAESDIYLQPSVSEGFCNAVLEAQLAGLFCIVSDAAGLPENVLHNKTGWVVPSRNPEAFAQKIEEVINEDKVILANIQHQAIERVKNEFNVDNQIKEFIKFYTF